MLFRSALTRNLVLDTSGSLGTGVALGVVTGLLPGMIRLGGADAFALSALAAAPFVANMFSLLAGYLRRGDPRLIAAIRTIGCASLLAVPMVPSAWVVTVVTVFWVSVAISTPMQHRVWGCIYPARTRGRLIGVVRGGQAVAAAATALAGGALADRVGNAAVLTCAGAVGVLCSIPYAGMQAPALDGGARFSWRRSLQVLNSHAVLRWLLVAQFIWGAGQIAAGPLTTIVQVDRLHLSLAQIGTLSIVTSAATVLAYLVSGAGSDRHGGTSMMLAGGVLGSLLPLGYAVANDLPPLWLASIAIGVANPALEIGLASVVSERLPLDDRVAAMAGWSAVTGVRGVGAPFLAAALVQGAGVSVSTALLGTFALAALGALCFLPAFALSRRPEPEAETPVPRAAPANLGLVAATPPGGRRPT